MGCNSGRGICRMQIIKRANHKTVDIDLSGKFTFRDHEAFKDVLATIAAEASSQVVLHMHALQFVDSAGLGMLLLAHDEAAKHNRKITITGIQGQVKKMFDMTRLDRMFAVQ